MSNDTCGQILCPMCGTRGEVRRYKNHARGKMYFACACGQIRPALNQSFILRNGEFFAGHPLAPEPALITEAKAAQVKATSPDTGQVPHQQAPRAPAQAGEPGAARDKATSPTPAPQSAQKSVNEKPPASKPVTKPESVKDAAPVKEPSTIFGGISLWK